MPSFHPPESLDKLKVRYHRALEHIEHIVDMEFPTLRPESTFDTRDGIRIIVTREDVGGSHPELHVSAAFRPNSPVAYRFAREDRRGGHDAAMGWFASVALARYRKISRDTAEFTHFEWPEMGFPHWRRTEI